MTETIELPHKLEDCHQLIQSLYLKNEELSIKVEELSGKLRLAMKKMYGQKSEQFKYLEKELEAKIQAFQENKGLLQLELFDDILSGFNELQKEIENSEKKKEPAEPQLNNEKKARISKKDRLENYDHLERETRHYGNEIEACPDCGSHSLENMGSESVQKLAIKKPEIIRIEEVTHKCKCQECGKIHRGEKPVQPIERCLADASLLTDICHKRFSLFLPYYRLHKDYLSMGVEISEANMCNWLNRLSEDVFKVLYDAHKKDLLSNSVIYCDETVFKELAKGRCKQKYIWGYSDPSGKDVIFEYSNRSRDNPTNFLQDFKNGFLVTDKYTGYDEICKKNQLDRAYCWLHGRRKFTDILGSSKGDEEHFKWLNPIVERIDSVLNLDRKIRDGSEGEILLRRKNEVEPLVLEFFELIDKLKIQLQLAPKNSLKKAIDYFLKHKEEFKTFLKDSRIQPTNNTSEGNLRFFTIGRKNWTFAATARGGRTAATLCSFVASAKKHGLNVRKYLAYVIENLPKAKMSEVKSFLPKNCLQFKVKQKK